MEHNYHPNGGTNLILWILGLFCYTMSNISAEFLYIWTFRGLSLISILMVIIINYPKVVEVFEKRKKEKGVDENKVD